MKYPVSDLSALLNSGKFADANPGAGISGSIDKARDMNAVYDELINLIVAGGLTPNEAQFNQVSLAVAAMIANAINGVVNSAPGALNQLNELATALGNDPNFATTIINALAGKAATAGYYSGLRVGKAATLAQGGGDNTAMTFNWAGQAGQPTWLWGSNTGVDHYVYNPSNFNVAKLGGYESADFMRFAQASGSANANGYMRLPTWYCFQWFEINWGGDAATIKTFNLPTAFWYGGYQGFTTSSEAAAEGNIVNVESISLTTITLRRTQGNQYMTSRVFVIGI